MHRVDIHRITEPGQELRLVIEVFCADGKVLSAEWYQSMYDDDDDDRLSLLNELSDKLSGTASSKVGIFTGWFTMWPVAVEFQSPHFDDYNNLVEVILDPVPVEDLTIPELFAALKRDLAKVKEALAPLVTSGTDFL